jgi:hypothetical protein
MVNRLWAQTVKGKIDWWKMKYLIELWLRYKWFHKRKIEVLKFKLGYRLILFKREMIERTETVYLYNQWENTINFCPINFCPAPIHINKRLSLEIVGFFYWDLEVVSSHIINDILSSIILVKPPIIKKKKFKIKTKTIL